MIWVLKDGLKHKFSPKFWVIYFIASFDTLVESILISQVINLHMHKYQDLHWDPCFSQKAKTLLESCLKILGNLILRSQSIFNRQIRMPLCRSLLGVK